MQTKWKHASRWTKRIRLTLRHSIKPLLGKCTMGLNVPYRKCCGRSGSKNCRYLPEDE